MTDLDALLYPRNRNRDKQRTERKGTGGKKKERKKAKRRDVEGGRDGMDEMDEWMDGWWTDRQTHGQTVVVSG